MKIGYFTSIEGWGGSEMYLLRLMLGVRERGYEVLLFGVAGTRLWGEAGRVGIERVAWKREEGETCDVGRVTLDVGREKRDVEHGDRTVKRFTSNVLRLTSLRSRTKRLLLRCTPGAIKLLAGNACEVLHLRRLFNAHPVDVMHVNVHGYEVAGVACRLTGIPSVGVYCIVPDPEENRLRRLLICCTGKGYQHIVGKSRFATELWQRVLKRERSDCTPVYNGVDLNRFRPSDNKKGRSSCLRIVTVGRLDKTKRFDVLIEAIAQMKDIDVFLTVVGDGPELDNMKMLAQKQGVLERVAFASYQDDVRPFLEQADVFCYPSEYDSFGQVLIEAMACGLSLVTSDYGPFPEINLDSETGFVVPIGVVNAFAAKLSRLHADPDLRKRLGCAARARAERFFGHDACIKKTIHVYQQVLDKTRIPIHE